MSDDKKLPVADVPTVTDNSRMRSGDVVDISQTFKDMYPPSGGLIKQWVVDLRREHEWERETCPAITVATHEDNTGLTCRNSTEPTGTTLYCFLHHDCCEVCDDLADSLAERADIAAWLAEKAKRPPIEQDRTKYSNEVEPHRELAPHPALGMLKR